MTSSSRKPKATLPYADIIKDDESLTLFLRKLREFDEAFTNFMCKGGDFTLRLEVRGNVGEVLHVSAYSQEIERPKGAQARIDKKVDASDAA